MFFIVYSYCKDKNNLFIFKGLWKVIFLNKAIPLIKEINSYDFKLEQIKSKNFKQKTVTKGNLATFQSFRRKGPQNELKGEIYDLLQRKLFLIIRLTVKRNMPGGTSRRGWTPQEDQIILQLMSASPDDKHKWVAVSKELYAKTGRLRTGKQCRERWQHQLNPAIVRDEWTQTQIITLFQKHLQFGNKWAKIAACLPGRTDNGVKNFIYSSVRRVLTKINLYLAKQRNRKEFKTISQFQSEYVSKLMAVVDGQYEKRLRLTGPKAFNLAKDLLTQISYLIIHGFNENIEGIDQNLDGKILMMHQFRKSCKKRKKINNICDQESQQLSSIEEGSSSKGSLLESPLSSSQKIERNQEKYKIKLQENSLVQIMDVQSPRAGKTQKSLKMIKQEQEYDKAQAIKHQMKNIQEFILRDKPSKDFVAMEGQKKEQVWNIVDKDNPFKQDFLKIQQQISEQKCKEESDIFSILFSYREEDNLVVNRKFDKPEVLTKSKMFEASLALDYCLLKAKKSQSFESNKKPESGL